MNGKAFGMVYYYYIIIINEERIRVTLSHRDVAGALYIIYVTTLHYTVKF